MPQERFGDSHALAEGDHPLGEGGHPLPGARGEGPTPFKLQESYEPGVNQAVPEEWTAPLERAFPEGQAPTTGPSMTPFDDAFKQVIAAEGGYVDHPADRGGRTIFGLSERAHPDLWVEGNIPTIADAHGVYKAQYWDRVNGDELSVLSLPLASVLFDSAVHHGPTTAVKMLQRAVGARPDGVIGPATLAAVGKHGEEGYRASIEAMLAARQDLFDDLAARDPSQRAFSAGWRNRLLKLRDLYLGNEN